MARTAIAEFGIIQKELKNAVVTIYVADEHGQNTGVLATLYQASTGATLLTNPQTLDEDGKLPVEVWVEDFVVAEISNISQLTERRLLKVRANPLTYPLPVTSSGKNSSDIINAKDDAEAAAATATAQAVIATAQAGTATTQANTATTQAGIATTQAGTATTKAAEASVSAAQAQAAAAGMKRKNPARAATTAALPSSTYANGTAGVGATLTATANGAFPAQDGVTLLVGEALLVKNESTQAHNGIYTLTNAGSAGTAWVLTRQTDSDTWDEIVAAVLTVTEGSTQADLDYLCTSNAGGTMGTTAITWQAYNTVIADGAVSTAAKIANNIITYAKMLSTEFASLSDVVGRIANKFVNAVTLFDWAEDRVPRRVYSANISAGAEIALTSIFRDGYNYRIELDNFQFAGASDFYVQFSSDNGATYNSGSSDYSWTGTRGQSSLLVAASASSGFIALAGDTLPATGGCCSIFLYNPTGASKRPRLRSFLHSLATGQAYHTTIFGERLTNMAVNAMRIYPVSSTFIAAGTITIYEEKI